MYINGNTGRLVERYRKEVDADPQRYHVTGWLRGGINQEKMEKIIEEKGADMGKEWTPEQKEKFKATMAAKRAERSAAVAGADPVKQDDDKRQAKILRDREYRARKKAEAAAAHPAAKSNAVNLGGNGPCIHQGVCRYFQES